MAPTAPATPTPTPSRSAAVPRHLGGAPGGGLHRGLHRHARAVGARGRARSRRTARSSRWSRSASGRPVDRQLARRPAGHRARRAAPRSLVGPAGRVADLADGCAARPTASGERELTRMYEYYDAVLHAVREGLLLVDPDGRVQLVNDEARRLLGLPDDASGRPVDELGLPPGAGRGRSAGPRWPTTTYVAGPAGAGGQHRARRWDGPRSAGRHAPRPHRAAGRHRRARPVRGLAEALRSQAHEAANRLHTSSRYRARPRRARPSSSPPPSSRWPSSSPTGRRGRSTSRCWPRCCSARPRRPRERGVELRSTGGQPGRAPVDARDLVTSSAT